MKNLFITIFSISTLLCFAQEEETQKFWPKEVETEGFVTTLYQPELESFKGNILEGRMALSINPTDGDIVFGAVWFKCVLAVDKDERTAVLEKMDIVQIHFPDVDDKEKIEKFKTNLSKEIESWDMVMSLDRIVASMKDVEGLQKISDNISNEPPVIYYSKTPTTLITIDGDPKIKEDKDNKVQYVLNTPFFIAAELDASTYFIKGGKFWYTSKSITEGWVEIAEKKVPKKVAQFAKNMSDDEGEPDSATAVITEAPVIIVSTVPAEIILTDGEPDYAAIEGTNLLYVKNSEEDIIMDIKSQEHYILVAGRWYHAKKIDDNKWTFEEPENLPEDFSKIPENSDIGNVRINIPGTPEAQDALLEQSIPQTATVTKSEVSLEVTYDGEPKFEPIEGTEMEYAINTDKSVIKIGKMYYSVDNAIWFESKSAKGPWKVSDKRPDEVDKIPADNPVYNIKYVYIYDSTPEVVYIGYLPGYNYSYVYGGVVVYGTGYYYQPWYGAYYYPHPVTYGYGVHYNPYTGWGFQVSMSFGYVGWGFHPHHSGYWGGGYHGGYRHGYGRGYGHNAYRRGYAAGYHNGNNRNRYNNAHGVRSTASRANRVSNGNTRNTRPSTKQNNVYSDRKGNTYKKDKGGNWQQQNKRPAQGGGNTRPSTGQKPSTRPSTGQKPSAKPSTRPSTGKQPNARPSTKQQPSTRQSPSSSQQLNRSQRSRQQGSSNYNRSPQRSSGGYRGGGGGGRSGGGGGRRR